MNLRTKIVKNYAEKRKYNRRLATNKSKKQRIDDSLNDVDEDLKSKNKIKNLNLKKI